MKILWIGLEQDIAPNHDILIMNKHNWDNDRIWDFHPDLVIEREFNDPQYNYSCEIGWIRKNLNCIIAVWLIDTHVQYDRHKLIAPSFDCVFMAISKYVDEFKQYNPQTYWLPLCFPKNQLPKKEKKLWPIGYVGRFDVLYLEDRSEFLHKLEKDFPQQCHFVTDYNSAYKIMAQTRVEVNPCYADDLNFRNFEALGSGCSLVTKITPDLFRIKDMADMVYGYFSYDECVSQLKKALSEQIKDRSEWIQSHHLLKHRANSLINMVYSHKQENF